MPMERVGCGLMLAERGNAERLRGPERVTSSNEGAAGTVGLLSSGRVHCESRREQASETGLRYHTKVSEWLSGWTGWNDGYDVVLVLVPLPLLTQRNHSNPSSHLSKFQVHSAVYVPQPWRPGSPGRK